MTTRVYNLLGWLGVLAILLAYVLVNFGLIVLHSRLYLLLNLLGSLAIVVETAGKKDYQPLILNILWAIVALFGLLSLVHSL